MSIIIDEPKVKKLLDVISYGLSEGLGRRKPGEMCVEAAVCYALGLPHGDDPGCVAPALRALKIRFNDANWSSNQARAKGLRRLAVAQLGSAGHLDEAEFRRRIVKLVIGKSVPMALRAAASIHKDEKHKAALCEAANRCEKEATREAATEAATTADAADAADAAAAAHAASYASYAADAVASFAADAASYASYAADDAAAASYAADAAAAAHAADATAAASYAADAAAADAAADAKKSARDKSLADFAEDVVQILIEMNAPGCRWLYLTTPMGSAITSTPSREGGLTT